MRRFSRRVIFRLVSRGRIAFVLLHRDPGETRLRTTTARGAA